MKLIFVTEIPNTGSIGFTHKALLDQHGYTYEYWDLRSFSGRHDVKEMDNPFPDLVIRKFTSHEEVDKAMTNEQHSIFIVSYILSSWNRFFYELIKKNRCRYIVLCNVMNFLQVYEPFLKTFYTRNGLFSGAVYATYSWLARFINRLSPSLPRPEYAIIGNRYDKFRYNFPLPKKGFIYTHALDYERLFPFLAKKTDQGYIVFIDQYLPYHNEGEANNRWSMKAETYYPKIRTFLLKLKEVTGRDVHIATHPKAEKGKIEQFISDIPVHYGKTNDLVSGCAFAVIHNSLAISLCVLQEKPLMFITCDELKRSTMDISIRMFGRRFNKPVFKLEESRLSDEKDLEPYLRTDLSRYKKYKEDNIKRSGTPEKPYWEIIVETLDSMKNGSSSLHTHNN